MGHMRVIYTHKGEEITLRPAVPEDAREIIETVCSVALERSYVLMEKYRKCAEAERHHINCLNREQNLLLVAQANNQVVGSLAALSPDDVGPSLPEGKLKVGLHLRQEYRGQKIGAYMLEYALEWAKARGFTQMEANIFTTNRRSLRLFDQAGFEEVPAKRRSCRIGCKHIEEVVVVKHL